MTSLVSCWNYLHSSLGVGKLQPISVEEAFETVEIMPPYNEVPFGSFTGNKTLIRYYEQLNIRYGVRGEAGFLYKKYGKNTTKNVNRKQALNKLRQGLQSTNCAYVYHCYNHYMNPVGYEVEPGNDWVIIGDISHNHSVFHTRRWDDIAADIECEYHSFVNIREEEFKV